MIRRDLHQLVAFYEPPDEDAPEIELTIFYTFTPGQPERGPTYACGGTPAESAEVEVDHVELEDGTAAPEFADWAAEYLQNKGYDTACEIAAEDLMPDPDDARDRMLDDYAEWCRAGGGL